MSILPTVALHLLGCIYDCPGYQAPIPVEVDWTARISAPAVSVGRLVGTIEGPANGGGWVCAVTCGEPWADAWVGSMELPHDPLPLPYHLDESDPVTGRDTFARLGVSVDAPVVPGDATTCDFLVSGPEIWTIDVEITP